MNAGILHLIPTPLGGETIANALPRGTLEIIATLDYFIAENEKSARHFLKLAGHPRPLRELRIERFDKDSNAEDAGQLLQPVIDGASAGVLSEAGCPGVADPGALLVAAAHASGIRVVPHVGPSALLLALMASGFNGQRFAFHGYLPVPQAECRAAIIALERESRARDQTQIFIETPYRNDALLETLLAVCNDATRLCVASDLMLPTESVRSATVAEWKKSPLLPGKCPSVFLLYAH
ncbi:MAG TPA: SAM-dependent methyltransferase [Burkholderiales bacterium]|nr:SAM-dependent methyltransferase [Burkholderiales bacterium]